MSVLALQGTWLRVPVVMVCMLQAPFPHATSQCEVANRQTLLTTKSLMSHPVLQVHKDGNKDVCHVVYRKKSGKESQWPIKQEWEEQRGEGSPLKEEQYPVHI